MKKFDFISVLVIAVVAAIVGIYATIFSGENNEFDKKCYAQSGIPVHSNGVRVCIDSFSVIFVENNK